MADGSGLIAITVQSGAGEKLVYVPANSTLGQLMDKGLIPTQPGGGVSLLNGTTANRQAYVTQGDRISSVPTSGQQG